MKRIAIVFLAGVFVMTLCRAAWAEVGLRPDFAQQWVREHPFMITGWAHNEAHEHTYCDFNYSYPDYPVHNHRDEPFVLNTPSELQDYLDAGMNYFAYTLPDNDTVPLIYHDHEQFLKTGKAISPDTPLWVWDLKDYSQSMLSQYPLDGDETDPHPDGYRYSDAGVILMRGDEPNTVAKLITWSTAVEWSKQNYPEMMVFTNVIGSIVIRQDGQGHDVNVGIGQDFIDYNKPDLLMSDYYPFRQTGAISVNIHNIIDNGQ